jgi:glutathione S-transferase
MIDLYDLAGADPALRFSPYCWRARMALAHKGLEPRLVPWRFHEHPDLPGAPQNRTVPVLVDSGDIVADSTAIAFHLEDRHTNGPSLFGGQGGEAHARFIIAWSDTVLMPAAAPIGIPYVFPQLDPADRDYFRQTREQRLGITLEQARDAVPEKLQAVRAVLAPLRRTLGRQDFLGGDEPSFADYAVFGTFQWLRCIGAPDLLEPDDKLSPWLEALLDLFGGLARKTPVANGNL